MRYKSLSDYDIKQLLIKYNIKLNDIIMSNENVKLYPGFYILNLDKLGGGGTHWTCFFFTGKMNLYFDSFGKPPPIYIEQKLGPLLIYNREQIQHPDSVACGYYCIAWIRFVSQGNDKIKSMNMFNNMFNDVNTNENQLKFFL